MKLFNKKIPVLLILVLTLVISSCSEDEFNENETNLTVGIDVLNTTRASLILSCEFYLTGFGPQTTYLIEYQPSLSEGEKNVIRQSYVGNINCIDYNYDPSNPDTELWNVYGFASGRPTSEKPDDPDIKCVTAR